MSKLIQKKFFLILGLCFIANKIFAAPICAPFTSIFPKELGKMGENPSVISLNTSDYNGRYYLIMSKTPETDTQNDGMVYRKWSLLKRQDFTKSVNYCLVATGNKVQPLLSVETSAGNEHKYGMPGTGFARCASGFLDVLDVRIWANRELGKSYVWSLPSNLNEHESYTLLFNGDSDWIMIKDFQNNTLHEAEACYDDRGRGITMLKNYKISEESIMKIKKIESTFDQ